MICTKCGENKQVSEFYTRANGNPANPCKQCKNANKKERRKDPAIRKKESEYVQAYKKTSKGRLSVERYNKSRRKYTDEEHEQMKADRLKARDDEKRQRANDWQLKIKEERDRKTSITEKSCRQCGKTLPIDHFYRYKSGLTKLDCKECMIDNWRIRDASSERKQWRNDYRKEHGRRESPEHVMAWSLTQRAIRSKKLIRPTACPKCGSTKNIQAHHEDYSKPLDIMWLCQLCHKDHHQKKKASTL